MADLVNRNLYESLLKEQRSFQDEINAVNADLKEMTRRKEEMDTIVSTYPTLISNTSTAIANAQEAVAESKMRIKQIDVLIDDKKSESEAIDNDRESLLTENAEKEAKIRQLQKDLEGAEDKGDEDEAARLRAEIAGEEAAVAANKEEIEALDKQRKILADEVAALKAEAEVEGLKVEKNTKLIDQLIEQLASYKEQLEEAQNELPELTEQIANATAYLENEQKKYEDWKAINVPTMRLYEAQAQEREENINNVSTLDSYNRITDEVLNSNIRAERDTFKVDINAKVQAISEQETSLREQSYTGGIDTEFDPDYLSAEDARKMMQKVIWGLKPISAEIKAAAMKGLDRIRVASISPTTAWALQQSGYSLTLTGNVSDPEELKDVVVGWFYIKPGDPS